EDGLLWRSQVPGLLAAVDGRPAAAPAPVAALAPASSETPVLGRMYERSAMVRSGASGRGCALSRCAGPVLPHALPARGGARRAADRRGDAVGRRAAAHP